MCCLGFLPISLIAVPIAAIVAAVIAVSIVPGPCWVILRFCVVTIVIYVGCFIFARVMRCEGTLTRIVLPSLGSLPDIIRCPLPSSAFIT